MMARRNSSELVPAVTSFTPVVEAVDLQQKVVSLSLEQILASDQKTTRGGMSIGAMVQEALAAVEPIVRNAKETRIRVLLHGKTDLEPSEHVDLLQPQVIDGRFLLNRVLLTTVLQTADSTVTGLGAAFTFNRSEQFSRSAFGRHVYACENFTLHARNMLATGKDMSFGKMLGIIHDWASRWEERNDRELVIENALQAALIGNNRDAQALLGSMVSYAYGHNAKETLIRIPEMIHVDEVGQMAKRLNRHYDMVSVDPAPACAPVSAWDCLQEATTKMRPTETEFDRAFVRNSRLTDFFIKRYAPESYEAVPAIPVEVV